MSIELQSAQIGDVAAAGFVKDEKFYPIMEIRDDTVFFYEFNFKKLGLTLKHVKEKRKKK